MNLMPLNFPYYYGRASEQYAFFRIPKLLISDSRFDGVSSDAKLLYLRYPDWKNWISYHIAPIFRGRTHSPVTWCSTRIIPMWASLAAGMQTENC